MQLEFLWRDESSLRADLEKATGLRVDLTITDNTSTMMTVRRNRRTGQALVRVHHMFLSANERVVRALARWVEHPRAPRSAELLNDFIDEHRHLIAYKPPVPTRSVVHGTCYDLDTLFREENAAHFGNTLTCAITWGKMPGKRRRRSIRFGSYSVEDNLVRIHPLLDQPFVPAYFVRYIVFHEMLHAFLGVEEGPTGRRRMHTKEFKARERLHPDYERSIVWLSERRNLTRLLHGTGKSG